MTSSADGGRCQPRLILASASPSRLSILQRAGFAPEVIISGVTEDGIERLAPERQVEELACRKARAVARIVRGPGLVVGCDSLLDVDGVVHGKPGTADVALKGWHEMAGRACVLRTGHCVIDTTNGEERSATTATTVHFATPSDRELAAYIASGEPLDVAGGFTLEGRGAAFVERIEGDAGNVMGLSVPTLRRLLGELGVEAVNLWA